MLKKIESLDWSLDQVSNFEFEQTIILLHM